MNRKKKQKQLEKVFWGTLFAIDIPRHLNEVPQHLDHVRMRLWDKVIDEYLELMVTQVKSINMLDLDETDITNNGIKHLTRLENLKELRLKGIHDIDNNSIPFLNMIKGLELLHIRNTSITLEGILQLDALTGLKTLIFSDKDDKPEKEKMLKLQALFPQCEIIVNSKVYYFEDGENTYS